MGVTIPIEVRLWSKVDKTTNPNGCWEWRGCVLPSGYGQICWESKARPVHRIAWMLLRGPIPPGKVMDHLCRNTICVNPDHLEVVTPKENALRGIGPTAMNAKQTHCIHGHAFSGENLYLRKVKATNSYQRHCRICMRMYRRRWRVKNPEYSRNYREAHR